MTPLQNFLEYQESLQARLFGGADKQELYELASDFIRKHHEIMRVCEYSGDPETAFVVAEVANLSSELEKALSAPVGRVVVNDAYAVDSQALTITYT